jgi:hypothetical protein
LFAEAFGFLLLGRQRPNPREKTLHKRNAQSEDDACANGCERVGDHGLSFPDSIGFKP